MQLSNSDASNSDAASNSDRVIEVMQLSMHNAVIE